MTSLFALYPSFGLVLTLLVYMVALWVNKKLNSSLANPLLIAVILMIALLVFTKTDVPTYQESAKFIGYLLTPATISLAIPIYKQRRILKENFSTIFTTVVVAMVVGLASIIFIAKIFNMDEVVLRSVLAKSVTTAIAIDVTEIIGGLTPIMVGSVVLTGIFGVVINEWVFKLLKIDSYFARGLGLGSSSHAMGTGESMKKNELQGAASSIAMVISGIIVAVIVPIIANWL
ncbi:MULTISPECIES: LrgB family protein [Aerococcus]|jgi:predicted murein hydrolase (TIGR00659 family)|uniref:LrgB family protein n=1 Tax=Aerococcus agrisoli TaxID=2487350 RepID=A0A3N4GTT6_9LACT|nr:MULTISPECIES: LrgB family protein [Aerococcus]OYQ66540.1 murein hydrolase effector LrgB [Aerococcus sp. 1KP-2016]RPA56404.1 LrgB family protein [Aerococcus agrisoli]